LVNVIVAAAGEPSNLVLGRVAGGEEDDRNARALCAEPARDLEAVDVGKHHVEDDQVRLEARDRGERIAAARRGLHGEAFEAKRHRDDLGDVRLIVDDEDSGSVGGV